MTEALSMANGRLAWNLVITRLISPGNAHAGSCRHAYPKEIVHDVVTYDQFPKPPTPNPLRVTQDDGTLFLA